MIRHVTTRTLPRPDAGEYAWPEDRVCVVLSDDAPLAAALAKRLVARGWRVAVHPHAAAASGLDWLAGRVGALISIAPPAPSHPPDRVGEALLGAALEEAWLLAQFTLARQLSPQLNAPGAPRTWFVAVTRLDGRLGLGATPTDSGVVAAGVHGLVKTLALEWPSVFCRAIDLHPDLDAAFAAERIVEELHDPDPTLGEVGHSFDGRVTFAVRERDDA